MKKLKAKIIERLTRKRRFSLEYHDLMQMAGGMATQYPSYEHWKEGYFMRRADALLDTGYVDAYNDPKKLRKHSL
jgi:hypothetical protein